MKKIYKIGILGYGGFGQFLHHYWDQLDEVEVVAVADTREIPTGHSLSIYSDWKALINRSDIDIIAIATPPDMHAEMACKAMDQGKHVLIEKPIGLSVVDARKVILARDQNHRVATVDYMMRFNPVVSTLRAFSAEKTFGELTHVAVQNLAQDSSLDKGHWFWNEAVSGGILKEHAVHFFDLVYYISGQKYKKVNALSSSRNSDQRDHVFASILHDNGLISTHYHAFSRPGFFEETSIRLVFDIAQIEIDGWIPLSGKITALVNDSSIVKLQKLPGFDLLKNVPIEQLDDQSRPEGWGAHSISNREIKSRDRTYQVHNLVEGIFSIESSKSEVYGQCVQSVLSDMIRRIEDPNHFMRITLEDVMESLEIAIEASH